MGTEPIRNNPAFRLLSEQEDLSLEELVQTLKKAMEKDPPLVTLNIIDQHRQLLLRMLRHPDLESRIQIGDEMEEAVSRRQVLQIAHDLTDLLEKENTVTYGEVLDIAMKDIPKLSDLLSATGIEISDYIKGETLIRVRGSASSFSENQLAPGLPPAEQNTPRTWRPLPGYRSPAPKSEPTPAPKTAYFTSLPDSKMKAVVLDPATKKEVENVARGKKYSLYLKNGGAYAAMPETTKVLEINSETLEILLTYSIHKNAMGLNIAIPEDAPQKISVVVINPDKTKATIDLTTDAPAKATP